MNIKNISKSICRKVNKLNKRRVDLVKKRAALLPQRKAIDAELDVCDRELEHFIRLETSEWQFMEDILSDILDEVEKRGRELDDVIGKIEDIELALEDAKDALDNC